MQFRRQSFSPQATFFFERSQYAAIDPAIQFLSASVHIHGGATENALVFLLSAVSELKRKNVLLFQVSSSQVSGRLPHEMYKVVWNIHVQIQVYVLKILCLFYS